MADTLQSLAGAIFKAADVIAALHAPLNPEQIVLDRYVFLPHARTGIAAALTTPFTWTLPARAAIDLRVPVMDARPGALDAEMRINVYGPADVTEIDPRQVIRTFPKADVGNAEVDDLAHVEFDRPDMPWLFTPAGPDTKGRLVPWITLIVAERRALEWGERRGTVRAARIRRDQLQPLDDAWAWAHAQVMGAKGPNAQHEPTLERRLSGDNAAHNLSRLVCPRRLDDRKSYVACVVPTFLAGAQTGLGLSAVSTLAPAWTTSGDPFDMVMLPVYYSWGFATGAEGNFESLARKLRPRPAPPGVGRRRVDTTRPWPGVALDADAPGAEMVVTGPVASPQTQWPDEKWPTEPEQHWPTNVTTGLINRLNRPDKQAHEPNPGPPQVGPPLYGGTHARQPRIETTEPAQSAQPQWFRELNTDARHRIVAGVGTAVVKAEQEDLMAAAWNQVSGIEAVNRALRLAQLAKHVSASLHARHLARFTDAAVLRATERVHPKVLDVGDRSVWASIKASSLPMTAVSGAFRRIARVRGPVVRASVKQRAARRGAVDALTVLNDHLTRNWVTAYTGPDGIRRLSALAAGRVTDALAALIDSNVDRDTLIATWRHDLAQPGPSDRLTADELDDVADGELNLGRELVSALVSRLLRSTPTHDEMRADPDVAVNGAVHAVTLGELAAVAHQVGVSGIRVTRSDAERLDINHDPSSGGSVIVAAEEVRSHASGLLDVAGEAAHDLLEEFSATAGRLGSITSANVQLHSRHVADVLAVIGEHAVTADPFIVRLRGRVDAPALDLVPKLNPAITVPARVAGRLRWGSGRTPGWLRHDWFDDLLVEPVMAHPRFTHPMYEPLHRYDREWMVPGLGLIERPDMTTLLQTNNKFIEAYLVGLNHEMARELLWREFPTDQRGTYFSSFWTGNPELVADMHQPPWNTGPLGSHVDKNLDGRLVLLVRGDLIRRYPGAVAHAAREADRKDGIPIFEADSPIKTLFHVHLPPNLLLAGFDMTRDRIDTQGEVWWFTLSENPTEPRFGLDASRTGLMSRDNLVWSDFDVASGGFLTAGAHNDIAFDGSQWGASSAQVAYLLFQLPARAAFLGKKMVAGATP